MKEINYRLRKTWVKADQFNEEGWIYFLEKEIKKDYWNPVLAGWRDFNQAKKDIEKYFDELNKVDEIFTIVDGKVKVKDIYL